MDSEQGRKMYIELLKKAILFEIWQEYEQDLLSALINRNQVTTVDRKKHKMGEIWPKIAHSMIGRMRMDNIQMCIETVLKDNIEGDFIETGVWRGGACIFMRGLLKVHEIDDRKVWLADSFQGLPAPNEAMYPKDKGVRLHTLDYLSVSLEDVQNNFRKYDLLDENVQFLKGWFKDTLPNAPIEKLAILRLDGDLYESTMDSLTNLYDKVSQGGFIIIDDYILPTCAAAITDFRRERKIQDPLVRIDNHSVYWRKHLS
ncbi:TylF/MycF family methyltransferase [Bacillus sp. FSL K6-3431]|uniref:TylF/MycF family methyltransferase n=1 Tax=Bacillus sp. FSL K6-3431 TaxID=2921500 RepID=UPI0030F997BB